MDSLLLRWTIQKMQSSGRDGLFLYSTIILLSWKRGGRVVMISGTIEHLIQRNKERRYIKNGLE